MRVYVLLGGVLGIALGYVFFYTRYKESAGIDALRSKSSRLEQELLSIQHDLDEYKAQNTILKTKVSGLIDQNEDYSKIISKLSRYYFHIKEANTKIDELKKLLHTFDEEFDRHLAGMTNYGQTHSSKEKTYAIDDEPKRFF